MNDEKIMKYFIGIEQWNEGEKLIYGPESEIFKILSKKKSLELEKIVELIEKIKEIENNPYRFGHSSKFLIYASTITEEFDFKEIMDEIKIASFFHDMGEIYLPFSVINSIRFTNEISRQYDKHTIYGANILKREGFDDLIVDLVKVHHPHLNQDIEVDKRLKTIMQLSEVYTGLTSKRSDRERRRDIDEIKEILDEMKRRFGFEDKVYDCFLEIINEKHKTKEWPIIFSEEDTITELEYLKKQKENQIIIFQNVIKNENNILKSLENAIKILHNENLLGKFGEIILRSASNEEFVFDPDGEYLYTLISVNFHNNKETKIGYSPLSIILPDGTIRIPAKVSDFMNLKTPIRWLFEEKKIQLCTGKNEEKYLKEGKLEKGYFKRVREYHKIPKDAFITILFIPLYYGDKLMGFIRDLPPFPLTEREIKKIIKYSNFLEYLIINSEEINPFEAGKNIIKRESNVPEEILINITPKDLEDREYNDAVVYFSDVRKASEISWSLKNKGYSLNRIIKIIREIFHENINNKQREYIIKNKGYFNKSNYDGIVGAWGVIPKWNILLIEKIENSLNACFEIFEWYKEYQKEVKEKYKGLVLGNLAIGLTKGSLITGFRVRNNSLEYALTGDIVTKAGRLSKNPNPGELWVDEDIAKIIKTNIKLSEKYICTLIEKEINKKIKTFGDKDQFYRIIKRK